MFKMHYIAFLLLIITIVNGANTHDDAAVPPEPPGPTPNPTTTTTSTTTTTKKTTTVTTPTTTTTTTTTSKPTPTTTVPTKPPTPTTSKPPTTTSPAPVGPAIGKWSVNYTNTATICIVVQLATQIDYINSTDKNATFVKVNVPKDAIATGTCGKDDQIITLTWNTNDSLTLNFKQLKDNKFTLSQIRTTLYDAARNGTFTFYHVNNDFITHDGNSYKCDKQQQINLTSKENSNVTVGHLLVSNVQFQAFYNTTKDNFVEAINCEPAGTSDVVPIAVGCALVALIILVLILYLIGRRRSQARGYLSM